MPTLTYCDNGHLWDRESGQRCGQCAAEANKQALDLVVEIEKMLAEETHWRVLQKLGLLRDILTD